MHIDHLLEQAKQCTINQTSMTFPSSWGQGRTAFGGLSAALLFKAIKQHVANDRPLRSLTTNFVGPLLSDTPFHFEVEVLREGKNASQVTARIIQEQQVVVLQQACFGIERFSEIEVPNHHTHDMPIASGLPTVPSIPGVTPNFISNVDLAIAKGEMPYSGKPSSSLQGWMRFKQAPQSLSDAHIICLIDAWPPAVLQMMSQPAPASTMMWNLEFIHPRTELKVSDWLGYHAKTSQAANGYAHLEADIWDSAGSLIAISRQSVAVFS